ncbi:endonuclease III domain-containing protein [Candidatus Margulisiibacteriota bacterium]
MKKNTFIKNLKILQREYKKWNAPVVTLVAHHSHDSFKILISTVLSTRTKDETTTEAVKRLFKIAGTPKKLSSLPVSRIKKLIYPVGFYNVKAGHIKNIAQYVVKHGVPDTREGLMKFKGVGRKVANLVLALGFNKPAICVDVHVHRISNRLGFIKTKTPFETEMALMEKVPKRYWNIINDLMVAFGQTICRPLSPKCDTCPLLRCSYKARTHVRS